MAARTFDMELSGFSEPIIVRMSFAAAPQDVCDVAQCSREHVKFPHIHTQVASFLGHLNAPQHFLNFIGTLNPPGPLRCFVRSKGSIPVGLLPKVLIGRTPVTPALSAMGPRFCCDTALARIDVVLGAFQLCRKLGEFQRAG